MQDQNKELDKLKQVQDRPLPEKVREKVAEKIKGHTKEVKK